MSISLALYLYYQTFKNYQLNVTLSCSKGSCYRHEDLDIEKKTKDTFEKFYDKVILSEEEEAAVIRHYAQLE